MHGWDLAIEADYVIIGAGAVGLAFADTILSESQYTVAIIDRYAMPGGHWNDAYDFVTLHQPSAFYGINALPLGDDRIDTTGPNAGLYELANGPDILSYFQRVMSQVLLPTGRCTYLPKHEHLDDKTIRALDTGESLPFKARRKWVDGTYYGTTVPSRHTPAFDVAPGAQLVPPNALSRLFATHEHGYTHVCVIGAGKTAMDAAYWLLRQGIDPGLISWVMPRDSWLLNRRYTQPGMAFFEETIGKQAEQMQILSEAESVEDLFLRLEAAGIMLRLDRNIMPRMYHCATMSEAEVKTLSEIKTLHREGRIAAITPSGLTFEQGSKISKPEKTLYIDCTATAVEARPARPVFEANRITLQMIRPCQPTFSAALAAHLELAYADTDRKNQLSHVPPLCDSPDGFLPMTLGNMMNQYLWGREDGLRKWMRRSRLDGFAKVVAGADPENRAHQNILARFRHFTPGAVDNLQKLMAAG